MPRADRHRRGTGMHAYGEHVEVAADMPSMENARIGGRGEYACVEGSGHVRIGGSRHAQHGEAHMCSPERAHIGGTGHAHAHQYIMHRGERACTARTMHT